MWNMITGKRNPQDAVIGSCELRVAGTSDQPTDHSEKVCGTPYTWIKGMDTLKSFRL
jgi:hypothetical protein